MNIKLGKSLRDVRKDAKLSQNDVAKIINCSRGTYSGWENDEGEIPLTKLLQLLNQCAVPLSSFIRKVEEDNNLTQFVFSEEAESHNIDVKAELAFISDRLRLINQNINHDRN